MPGGHARGRRGLETDRTQDIPPRLWPGVLGIGFTGERAKAHGSTPNTGIEATSVPEPRRGSTRRPPDTTTGYLQGACNPWILHSLERQSHRNTFLRIVPWTPQLASTTC